MVAWDCWGTENRAWLSFQMQNCNWFLVSRAGLKTLLRTRAMYLETGDWAWSGVMGLSRSTVGT